MMPHLEDPLLQAYIDGYCNDARTAEIDAHLAGCAECRQRLDEARQVAARASELLGVLEPGPVHAPSFEELQAQAASRVSGDVADDVATKIAEAATPATKAGSRSLWSSPSWAWAASLAIAFALGWLSRAGVPLPPVASLPPDSFEEVAPASPRSRAIEMAPGEQFEVVDEFGDVEAADVDVAATRPVAEVPAVDAPLRSNELSAELRSASVQEAEGRIAGEDEFRAAGEARKAEQQVTTTGPPASPARNEPEPPPVLADRLDVVSEPSSAFDNEELAQFGVFADAGVAGGYVSIDVAAVEAWLGVPPRQLPDLELLRAEVGPGTMIEDGIPERPAVRLVYLSSNQQEISLVQQYLGPVGGGPLAGDNPKETAAADDRSKTAGERARAQTPQPVQSRVDRQLLPFSRDAAVGGVASEAPIVRSLNGVVAYGWIDVDGYVLWLSGSVDPDVLRGLADRVR